MKMESFIHEIEEWKEPVFEQITLEDVKDIHISDHLMSITFTIKESTYPFRIIYEKQPSTTFKEKATDVKFTHYSYPTKCFTHQKESLQYQLFSHPNVQRKQHLVHPFKHEDFIERFYS
jgi:hypothetical protein